MTRYIALLILSLAVLPVAPVFAESTPAPEVLIVNYSAKLKIADEIGEIKGQAKVRDQGTFPIEFQDHRVEISVLVKEGTEYSAKLNLLEKGDSGWYSINSEAVSIMGYFEVPVEFIWSEGDFKLDLAMAISLDRTQ